MNKAITAFHTSLAILIIIGFSGCRQPGVCIVKGTVEGVRNGTRIELKNAWNLFEIGELFNG